jgi:mono/diheme cytochrome c family protein
MSRGKVMVVLMAGLVVVLAVPAIAGAQVKREAAPQIDSIDGVDTYNAYCAVCHGKDGKGGGPAAAVIKTPIPDLTTMAKRAGKFSAADVEAAITGKGKVMPAHGSPDMPIWGPVFRALSADDAMRQLRLANLVKYIESLQQK